MPPHTRGKKDSQCDKGKVAVPLVQLQRAGEDGDVIAGRLIGGIREREQGWGGNGDAALTHSPAPLQTTTAKVQGHSVSIP